MLKPTQGSGFSCSVPQPARTARKTCLSHTNTLLMPRVLVSQGTDHDQTWRAYAPLVVGSSLPSLRVVDGLCLKVSLGTWGPDPVMYQLFAIQNRTSFPIRKNDPEMGDAPTSQARPRDTDQLQPSNLAGRSLSLVEHTLSNFGGDPYPVRRTRGSGEVLRAKITFFLVSAAIRNDPSLPTALLAGVSTTKGNFVLFSVFRSHNNPPEDF